ncbi:hypothetical protein Sxan_36450 [Streptomyces xanthophaeus]|uniref:Uncharacterized protein n=1 Tax=Streptomyces xanthophaeus TaxID=67385 RepID=A0A919GX43_9ACTN|nr:hypothetical protein Sxan_36450 [Streptomyces xanthophaeus]
MRVPGLIGDDQVTGVHTGYQPGAEPGREDGGPLHPGPLQRPSDGPFGRARAHAGAQQGVPAGPCTAGSAAGAAQRGLFDAQGAGDQQRGGGRLGGAHHASPAGEACARSGAKGSPYR